MKIERIKKSLDACRVHHAITPFGQVYCEWYDPEFSCRCTAYFDSYGSAYRKLKEFGALSKERYLLNRYG